MPIAFIGAGSIATADVRSAFATESPLPTEPHFVIRASHSVPLALSTLALDFTLLIQQPIHTTNGFLAVPIKAPLKVGQALIWTMLTGAAVPQVAAFLTIEEKLKYLKHKNGLGAGTPWSPEPVVLRALHLS